MIKPPGFTTVFPYIFATDTDSYLSFLQNGLGGKIGSVHRSPDGRVANAQIVFGDTTIMVSDAAGWSGPTHGTYYRPVAGVRQKPHISAVSQTYAKRLGREPAIISP